MPSEVTQPLGNPRGMQMRVTHVVVGLPLTPSCRVISVQMRVTHVVVLHRTIGLIISEMITFVDLPAFCSDPPARWPSQPPARNEIGIEQPRHKPASHMLSLASIVFLTPLSLFCRSPLICSVKRRIVESSLIDPPKLVAQEQPD
jgi:hypothetical protein